MSIRRRASVVLVVVVALSVPAMIGVWLSTSRSRVAAREQARLETAARHVARAEATLEAISRALVEKDALPRFDPETGGIWTDDDTAALLASIPEHHPEAVVGLGVGYTDARGNLSTRVLSGPAATPVRPSVRRLLEPGDDRRSYGFEPRSGRLFVTVERTVASGGRRFFVEVTAAHPVRDPDLWED